MSLARQIFTLPQPEQDAAIEFIARKAIQQAVTMNIAPRKLFMAMVRPLTHAKHSAGMPKDELRTLSKHYRYLFHQEERAFLESAQQRDGSSRKPDLVWQTQAAGLRSISGRAV